MCSYYEISDLSLGFSQIHQRTFQKSCWFQWQAKFGDYVLDAHKNTLEYKIGVLKANVISIPKL